MGAVDDRLLVEDERLFTLVDRAKVEAAGDGNGWSGCAPSSRPRTPRWRTPPPWSATTWRRSTAMWSPGYAAGHGQEVRPQIATVRRAELIGSVGPRTLVWLVMDDGEHTVELLWRSHDGRLLIEGARTFTPGPA